MDIEAKTNKYSPTVATIFLVWFAYAGLDLILKTHNVATTFFGISTYLILLVLQIIAVVYSYSLSRAPNAAMKKTFVFFSIALILVIIDSTIYHIKNNILHISAANTLAFWSNADNIPYVGYLVFQLLAWSTIISAIAKKNNTYKAITYIPVISIVLVVFIAFIIGIINLNQFSLNAFFGISDKSLELVNLTAALVCLALSKNRGLFYLALGFALDTSFSTAMDFGVLGQSYGINSIVETIWILSWLLRIYGLSNLKQSVSSTNSIEYLDLAYKPNSLRVQFTFWIFVLCSSALFLFLITSYLAQPNFFF